MMNRVRRTARQKSPGSSSSEESIPISRNRPDGRGGLPLFSGRGSPILTHRSSTGGSGMVLGGGGLGASYAITFGGYKSNQQVCVCGCRVVNNDNYRTHLFIQHSQLQSVMRNLVDSEDEQERQVLRMKLESDLQVASERLDNLVQGWCGCGHG